MSNLPAIAMHFKHYDWNIKKLQGIREDIDPKPQYQRGDAWDDRARSLLIDSILNNYDIPKLYLRHAKDLGNFEYEVADGQQRLKALWKFFDGEFALQGMSGEAERYNGVFYSDLPQTIRKQIEEYVFITTVVYGADNDQIRELFRRLQLGVRLNPAELRNSMASALGDSVRAMALSHPFFPASPFSLARYKADDLVAHAFAIVIYNRQRDIKAPDLREMYSQFSGGVDPKYATKVNQVLHFMNRMQKAIPRCVDTKWGFVDVFGVLCVRKLSELDPREFGNAYRCWEADRAEHMSDLPSLAASREGTRKRMLYEYIVAFQKEGATKRSLQIRFDTLNKSLPGT